MKQQQKHRERVGNLLYGGYYYYYFCPLLMAYFNFRLQKKILEAVSEPEPVRLVTKPLSDRITPFQTRSTKLVERFTDLYKNDRVQVTGALKGMPDRSSAERLMFTVVEVRLYNAYVHNFM